MPKVLIFAVCEKALIDVRQLPSLISIFQRMQIMLQDAPMPEGATSPVRWDVFTLWQHTEEEVGTEFRQRVVAYKPNGQPFIESFANFTIQSKDDLQSKNVFEMFGIPIEEEGMIRVVTFLGDSEEPIAEYSFAIKYVRRESNG